ncbi:MAG: hypothetical protein KF901_02290 [Myxococcales bacterium]|nr:hypothetical protein [Myxococcales bacterium]
MCLLAFACGGDDDVVREDTGTPRPDGAATCTSTADCDDGRFCNGQERCLPDDPRADALGCVMGTSPCDTGGCDEARDRCVDCARPDADGDGYDDVLCGGNDCDDANPAVNPGALEVCDPEGIDEDCDPSTFGDRDEDGDTYVDARCCNGDRCGTDCDDRNPSIHPGMAEVCNRRDDDCDGLVDEDTGVDGFVDMDADGRGDTLRPLVACPGSARFAVLGDDCDDTDPMRNPALVEVCDGIDNDCDGRIDENARAVLWYRDADGDGYGDPGAEPVASCAPPPGYVLNALDCDDSDAEVHPGASERCNGIDDDCDGVAVFDGRLEDADGDGFPAAFCGASPSDCDDGNARIYPGAPERCNGIDDDCDGRVDEAITDGTWYLDEDRDGWGSAVGISSCLPPGNYVPRTGDCAPTDRTIHPGAAELCDGIDQDCDGRVDEGPAIAQCAASGQQCISGACVDTGCPAGERMCPLIGCVDTAVHADHCGGCNLECGQGDLCRDAECRGWDAVEVGEYPSCARSGGRVYCWGRVITSGTGRSEGEIDIPHTVVGMDDATSLSAGGGHTCVLRGGLGWCWGLNPDGRLGDGTTERRLVPVRVASDLALTQIDAGANATCALAAGAGPVAEGTIYCWGENLWGVARPSLAGLVLAPSRVSEVVRGVEVAVGAQHACVRNGDGLYCWGSNPYRQLGLMDITPGFVEPRQVYAPAAGEEVRNVATGPGHTCFVTSPEGLVRCLGANTLGQAGAPVTFDCTADCRGDHTCQSGTCLPGVGVTVVQRDTGAGLVPLDGVIAIGAGNQYSCAVRIDGSVWCWGDNSRAQLGRNPDLLYSHVALEVPRRWLGDAYDVTAGGMHACVLAEGGRVWCWGENGSGQTGTGTFSPVHPPFPLRAPVR